MNMESISLLALKVKDFNRNLESISLLALKVKNSVKDFSRNLENISLLALKVKDSVKILANSKERDLILRMEISMISQDHLDQVYIQKNLVLVNSVDLTMAHPDLKDILKVKRVKKAIIKKVLKETRISLPRLKKVSLLKAGTKAIMATTDINSEINDPPVTFVFNLEKHVVFSHYYNCYQNEILY